MLLESTFRASKTAGWESAFAAGLQVSDLSYVSWQIAAPMNMLALSVGVLPVAQSRPYSSLIPHARMQTHDVPQLLLDFALPYFNQVLGSGESSHEEGVALVSLLCAVVTSGGHDSLWETLCTELCEPSRCALLV